MIVNSFFRYFFIINVVFIFFYSSCKQNNEKINAVTQTFDYSIDTSAIPKDTVIFTNPKVSFVNGIYLFEEKPFSGVVIKVLKGYDVKTYSAVLDGKLHGTYRSFHKSGKPYEVRRYKNNISLGRQYGYWESTGKLMFEYNYFNNKQEGLQKSWYEDGSPYYEYHYKDDKLEGLQRAWRKNGSLYRNFEAKDGIFYGLQNSMQCTEVKDGKIRN